jgi:hypothetical protein
MMTDPFIMIFAIVAFISILCLLLKVTPILSQNPLQKKLILFSGDIIVTSAIFFIIIYSAKSPNAYMIFFYALFYIGIIYYKSRSFITTKE